MSVLSGMLRSRQSRYSTTSAYEYGKHMAKYTGSCVLSKSMLSSKFACTSLPAPIAISAGNSSFFHSPVPILKTGLNSCHFFLARENNSCILRTETRSSESGGHPSTLKWNQEEWLYFFPKIELSGSQYITSC